MTCRCKICGHTTDCGEDLCPICETPEEPAAPLTKLPTAGSCGHYATVEKAEDAKHPTIGSL